jgi:hypothetical protein
VLHLPIPDVLFILWGRCLIMSLLRSSTLSVALTGSIVLFLLDGWRELPTGAPLRLLTCTAKELILSDEEFVLIPFDVILDARFIRWILNGLDILFELLSILVSVVVSDDRLV